MLVKYIYETQTIAIRGTQSQQQYNYNDDEIYKIRMLVCLVSDDKRVNSNKKKSFHMRWFGLFRLMREAWENSTYAFGISIVYMQYAVACLYMYIIYMRQSKTINEIKKNTAMQGLVADLVAFQQHSINQGSIIAMSESLNNLLTLANVQSMIHWNDIQEDQVTAEKTEFSHLGTLDWALCGARKLFECTGDWKSSNNLLKAKCDHIRKTYKQKYSRKNQLSLTVNFSRLKF